MCVLHGDRGILARRIRGLQKDRGSSKAFSTQVTITCIPAALEECVLGPDLRGAVCKGVYALQGGGKHHQGIL